MKNRDAVASHEIKLMQDTADSELRLVGEDQLAYISMIPKETQEDLTAQIEDLAEFDKLWGVYSASGELLVVCDSPASAWEYADENELKTVKTH